MFSNAVHYDIVAESDAFDLRRKIGGFETIGRIEQIEKRLRAFC